MPYQVKWLVAERIIYMSVTGEVAIQDIMDGNRDIMKMLESGTPFVHLVTDAMGMEKNNIGFADLITVIKTIPSSPNLGWSIYVSRNKLDRFFASVATQISKARNREFDNLDDALAFLQQNDPTLPVIPLP